MVMSWENTISFQQPQLCWLGRMVPPSARGQLMVLNASKSIQSMSAPTEFCSESWCFSDLSTGPLDEVEKNLTKMLDVRSSKLILYISLFRLCLGTFCVLPPGTLSFFLHPCAEKVRFARISSPRRAVSGPGGPYAPRSPCRSPPRMGATV